MDKRDRLAWMDLVVTDPDPDQTMTVELSFAVTDGELEFVAQGPSAIMRASADVLAPLDDWRHARPHDARVQELQREPASAFAAAEAVFMDFLESQCGAESPPLAGDDIALDRRFLRRFMPRLDEYLHYRIIDVATVEELVMRWYPAVHAAAPSRNPGHRAADGIREAIAELRYYRQTVFR